MRTLFSVLCLLIYFLLTWTAQAEIAAVEKPVRQPWSFSGVTGNYNRDQLRRGLQVYEAKCRSCHSMNYLEFRSLITPGGPELTLEEAKELAEGYLFPSIAEDGSPTERSGTLTDSFISPYLNSQEAKYLNNGKEPVDLTYITRARSYDRGFPLFLLDMALPYTEHGSDYVYAILTGYPTDANEENPVVFNRYFPGGTIAMGQQLQDGLIEYPKDAQGQPVAPETVDQYARDVTAFLTWAADPTLVQRKKTGAMVFTYLLVLFGLVLCLRRSETRD